MTFGLKLETFYRAFLDGRENLIENLPVQTNRGNYHPNFAEIFRLLSSVISDSFGKFIYTGLT